MRPLVVLLALVTAVPSFGVWRCFQWIADGVSAALPSKAERMRRRLSSEFVDSYRLEEAFAAIPREEAKALYPLLAKYGYTRPSAARIVARIFAGVLPCDETKRIAAAALDRALLVSKQEDREAAVIVLTSLAETGLARVAEADVRPDREWQMRLFYIAMDIVLLTGPSRFGKELETLATQTERIEVMKHPVALFRWLLAPTTTLPPEAAEGLGLSLLALSPVGRVEILNRAGRVCDPIHFAGVVFDQVIAETDLPAWNAEIELYTQVMEALAASPTLRPIFARSDRFARIRGLGFDLRSRRIRELHGITDTSYDLPGRGEPPYLTVYNAQLRRIQVAQEKILKP